MNHLMDKNQRLYVIELSHPHQAEGKGKVWTEIKLSLICKFQILSQSNYLRAKLLTSL